MLSMGKSDLTPMQDFGLKLGGGGQLLCNRRLLGTLPYNQVQCITRPDTARPDPTAIWRSDYVYVTWC